MKPLGLDLMDSKSAIQPIVVGENHRAQRLGQALFASGIQVSAIRPPTVPKGSARLRVTLSAMHEFNQIDQLIEAVKVAIQSD